MRYAFLIAASIPLACGEDQPAPSGWLATPEQTRADLVEYVYRDGTVPTAGPDLVTEDVEHELFVDAPNLARIDTLRFDLGLGLWSQVYLFWPEAANGRFVIYHLGHYQGLDAGDHVARWLVERGYAVVVSFMPFYGGNPTNVEVEWRGERYPLGRQHSALEPLERAGANVFHLFFEPLARLVQHATVTLEFDRIAMVGLSGGGWTTDIFSALEPRVRDSYSVAGSLPFRLRASPDIGDFEQHGERPFYDRADFMEIYFLAAQGEGQRHRQILHENDTCCFAWSGRADAIRRYEASVRARLDTDPAGGSFSIHLLRDLGGHDVYEEDLEIIHRELSPTR